MKSILFPTDFSEAANKAFIFALHLAKKWQASITTYHVYRPIDLATTTRLPVRVRRVYETIELQEFEDYRDSIPPLRKIAEEAGFGNVELHHMMEERENVIPGIIERSKTEEPDLIVMGTTGASGFKEIFLGSVAGEVLERAHCPVLAVPEKNEFDGKIDQLVFTTNFEDEERSALDRLIEFAQPFDAEIHVVNIDTGHTDFYHHRMDKFKADYQDKKKLRFHVLDGVDIYEELTDYLEEHPVDFLAMVTHKRNFIQGLFNYSKTKKLSYHSDTPVLSFPAEILE